MIKNYFKVAWRNLLKNKVYFLINILGLSISLTVSFLMLLWVFDEHSMDKFHEKEDQLYLAKRTVPLGGGVLDVYENVSYPMLEAAKEQIPEIERYGTIGFGYEDNLKVDNVDFRAVGTFANSDFFKIFSFPIIAGDATQLDKKVETIVISESLAQRMWGDNWRNMAIGSTIQIMDNGDFSVEAVYKDFPTHSSIQNDFYYSFNKYLKDNDWMNEWGNNAMQGVLLLRQNTGFEEVSKKLNALFQANISGDNKEGVFLQKYSDSYLYGKFDERAKVSGGRIEYVRIFTIAAIFLLIVSCINFVNLSTAYAVKRSGEIGVRKVVGARKKTLIQQFLVETTLITSISFVAAFLFAWMLLPTTNTFVDKHLDVNLGQPIIWLGIFIVFIVTTFLSGAYPAFVISSFKPVEALKGKAQEQKKTISFRKGLVVLQFGLTMLLIVAAIIVRQQVNYINQKDLGIAKEHLISIHQDQELTKKYDALKGELIASSTIADVTLVGPSPLDISASTSNVIWPGKDIEQENIEFTLLWTAHNFPEVFEVPVSKGAYYRDGSTDTLNIVINERALEIMNIKDPIGKTIQLWGKPRQIIGVLKDFHNRSLYEDIQPSVFLLDPLDAGMMFVKLEAGKTKEALATVNSVFERVLPDIPLHYEFVDQEYAAQYKSEMMTGSLTYYFAIISILISCLGLFGLATFMAKRRTKEIGIRKVLGASIGSITALISKDFLKLVLWAILLSSPIAYLLMRGWLEDFTYRIDIQWWVFAVSGILAVIITLLTVGFQSVKSALANPVKSLRTE